MYPDADTMVTLDELVVDSDTYYSLLDFVATARKLNIISGPQVSAMNSKFKAAFEEAYGWCFDCDNLTVDCRCYFSEDSTGFIYSDE